MPKILFFDHSAQFGGAEKSLAELIVGLRNVDSILVTSSETMMRKFETYGIRCILFNMPGKIVNKNRNTKFTFSELSLLFNSIFKFINLLKTESPDLVYTNTQKAHIIGGVAGRIQEIPVCIHFRDIFQKNLTSKLWVYTIYSLATSLIAISMAVAEQFPHSDKVKTVYNGIDTGKTVKKYQSDKRNIAPTIGYVGQIARWKGVEFFIQAASIVIQKYDKPVNFVIIGGPIFGDERYLEELKDLAHQLKINDKIQFKGVVEDALNEIAGFDVLVHLPVEPEPFGRVLIEAGTLGKPVIATNLGAIPEIVINNQTGFVVPPKEASAAADSIIKLLEKPDLIETFGENARSRIKKYFDLNNTLDNIENIIKENLK